MTESFINGSDGPYLTDDFANIAKGQYIRDIPVFPHLCHGLIRGRFILWAFEDEARGFVTSGLAIEILISGRHHVFRVPVVAA